MMRLHVILYVIVLTGRLRGKYELSGSMSSKDRRHSNRPPPIGKNSEVTFSSPPAKGEDVIKEFTKYSVRELVEAIEDADIIAESVNFIAEKNKFTILAEGDLSKVNIEIPKGENVNIAVETDDVLKSKYSIEYMKKIMQASKLSEEVSIQFNKDYPLKLEYKEINKVMLSFILAPRVEND